MVMFATNFNFLNLNFLDLRNIPFVYSDDECIHNFYFYANKIKMIQTTYSIKNSLPRTSTTIFEKNENEKIKKFTFDYTLYNELFGRINREEFISLCRKGKEFGKQIRIEIENINEREIWTVYNIWSITHFILKFLMNVMAPKIKKEQYDLYFNFPLKKIESLENIKISEKNKKQSINLERL
jgi:hypothetical protein